MVRRRSWLGSLAGAALAAGLFALFVWLRSGLDWDAVSGSWDYILVVAALGGGLTAIALAVASLRQRAAVRRLAEQLGRFRYKPGGLTREALTGPGPAQEMEPLLPPIEALCAAYRRALKDRVKLEESLASLRSLLGKGATGSSRAMTIVGRTSGSGRNMIGRLTANLHWQSATPALQQFLGVSADELNGRPFLERVEADDAGEVHAAFHNALVKLQSRQVDFRLRTPGNGAADTDLRYVRVEIQLRRSDKTALPHFRCHFTDITRLIYAENEAKRRTRELAETKERLARLDLDLERLKYSYHDLYHNAPVMFFSLDPQGNFVSCNDTMLKALGYERDDLTKQAYVRLLPPASRGDWERSQHGTADGGLHLLAREGEVECQWLKKDGSVIEVWIRTVPIRDAAGQFVRSRSAALDMTLRHSLSQELRRRGDELERANTQLRRTNRELEEFTSVVSHDLKEPLRTIQAYSNSLAQDFGAQLGPDGFQSINHLLQASRRLGTLIEDLLALSGAGRITRALETFDFIEVVATVRRDLADLIQRKRGEVYTEGSLPIVVGDPRRITQLVSNLVGNALKYNRAPVPRVVIAASADAPHAPHAPDAPDAPDEPHAAHGPPGFVTISVRDNGIGIDPKHHEHIFGLFRRLHAAEAYEGTGAGLAICKKIVEAHGGRIWVESTPGQGAAFYFTLPGPAVFAGNRNGTANTLPDDLARTARVRATEPTPRPRTRSQPRTVRAGAKPLIFLVEDTPEIALLTQKLSLRAGHEMRWLPSAEEAWEALLRDRPDLLLLDVHLPGMSGLDLCRRLRMEPGLSDLPVALFTQSRQLEENERPEDAGADYLLTKDLLTEPKVWLRHLEEILEGKAAPLATSSDTAGGS